MTALGIEKRLQVVMSFPIDIGAENPTLDLLQEQQACLASEASLHLPIFETWHLKLKQALVFHVAGGDLNFFWSFCFHFTNAGIAGAQHHTGLRSFKWNSRASASLVFKL